MQRPITPEEAQDLIAAHGVSRVSEWPACTFHHLASLDPPGHVVVYFATATRAERWYFEQQRAPRREHAHAR